jgi:hypothetical protein
MYEIGVGYCENIKDKINFTSSTNENYPIAIKW